MTQPRTPILHVLRGVARMLVRRAMVGWTLKAFSTTVLCLLPPAVVGAYVSLTPVERPRLFPLAGGVAFAAAALFLLGTHLRRNG
jgi:hypothetical protein